MAPSSNYTLIALLVAFAVVVPSQLHQSAAARDSGAATKAAAGPAPSANGGEVVVHPTAAYEIPDLPLPRILPCPPAFPKIPFIPCYDVTPPAPPSRPTECRTTLAQSLVPPCSGFLTDDDGGGGACGSEARPSSECCDGVKVFFSGDQSVYDPLCLCHVMNGGVSQLLPAPVNHMRALALLQACLDGVNPQPFSNICNNDQAITDTVYFQETNSASNDATNYYATENEMPPMDLPNYKSLQHHGVRAEGIGS